MPSQKPQFFHQPQMVSALEFMGTPGQCFYVPAYQRDFSWEAEEIDRFFEDVESGIRRLMREKEDVVTFIGTMICFHDTEYATIHPLVRNDVPRAAFNVIDGQQRLTLLLLAASTLHDFLRVAGKRDIGSTVLTDKRAECMADLARVIEQDMVVASGDTPHYPRMIRAFEDQWAKKSPIWRYRSPLSHFVSSYGAYYRENAAAAAYKHKLPPGISESEEKRHKKFLQAVNKIRQAVAGICTGKAENFPDVKSLMDEQAVLSGLLNSNVMPPEDGFNSEDDAHAQVARAIILASYILKKVWFVTLVTLDENYAFDIFEALNTTGQVLTAFETFRPEVIRAEKIENFEESDSKTHLDAIESYLGGLNKKNQKIKTTGEMLISFALAEDGRTIPKDLRSQRNYLRKSYSLPNLVDQREFTRHLMHASEVMQIWHSAGSTQIPNLFQVSDLLEREAETARFCLDFLASSNHHIVRALITRFHAAARMADDGRDQEKIADLFSVIKALAAFYAIWRGSREGTDGIDSRHRKLMRDNFSRIDPESSGIRDGELSAEDVKRRLVARLKTDGGNSERKIQTLGDWIEHATTVPIYATSAHIARFLLLVAADGTRPKDNGLLEEVRDGAHTPLIAGGTWRQDDYATIEHIIPQSKYPELGCEKEALDRLGNLTLVPRKANSILGDRPWMEKKAIFRALSAETNDELLAAKDGPGFPLDLRESDHLQERHLPMTKAVAKIERFEKIEDFEERGKNLAELAWKRLAVEWLGFPNE